MQVKKSVILESVKDVEKWILRSLEYPSGSVVGVPANIDGFKAANITSMAETALQEFKGDFLNKAQYDQFVSNVVSRFKETPVSKATVHYMCDESEYCNVYLRDCMTKKWDIMVAMQPYSRLLQLMRDINASIDQEKVSSKCKENFRKIENLKTKLEANECAQIQIPLEDLKNKYKNYLISLASGVVDVPALDRLPPAYQADHSDSRGLTTGVRPLLSGIISPPGGSNDQNASRSANVDDSQNHRSPSSGRSDCVFS